MESIGFRVFGDPVPQGSMQSIIVPPAASEMRTVLEAIMAAEDSRKEFFRRIKTIAKFGNKEKLIPWRETIAFAAKCQMAGRDLMRGSLDLRAQFVLRRPKSHYRTGKFAHLLREDAPADPYFKKADIDKLLRAVLDALTGVVYEDDAQVCGVSTDKIFINRVQKRPCVIIKVSDRDPVTDPTLFELEPEDLKQSSLPF